MEVKKTIRLNLLRPTGTKRKKLKELEEAYRKALSHVVAEAEGGNHMDLQNQLYREVRGYGLHSQIANDLFKDASAIISNGGEVKRVSIPYNIPRSGRFNETERRNPVVAIATLEGRIAIPIAKDGAYQRLIEIVEEGYVFTHFKLSRCRSGWKIYAALRKEFPVKKNYDSVLGVDVGVHRLAAVSVVSPEGRVLRQLYLGQDVGDRQRDICLRRSMLRGHADKGSRYARQALRRLRKDEDNYTATRCWQVAHEIVTLATKYNALIGIEDLRGLRDARGNKKGNRKSKRMPYYKFRVALESVAGQNGVKVIPVEASNTSKTCSRCGAQGIRNGGYFRCPSCGYEANADRNASVNVAIRAGYHPDAKGFYAQIPGGNHAVNRGVLVHDGIDSRCLRHFRSSPRQAPVLQGGGS